MESFEKPRKSDIYDKPRPAWLLVLAVVMPVIVQLWQQYELIGAGPVKCVAGQ